MRLEPSLSGRYDTARQLYERRALNHRTSKCYAAGRKVLSLPNVSHPIQGRRPPSLSCLVLTLDSHINTVTIIDWGPNLA